LNGLSSYLNLDDLLCKRQKGVTEPIKIKMFDYKTWIERATFFTDNLAQLTPYFDNVSSEVIVQSTLTESELTDIASKVDKRIPQELAQFWLTGSQHSNCSYLCGDAKSEIVPQVETIFGSFQEIYGGASFINATDLPQHLLNCRDWAQETWVAEYPQDKAFWLNSVPFVEMNNGDYLALDVTEGRDNPPVVYLSHDDESFIIAESFTDFLTHWERLCYIGPEIWMLENFRSEDGYINSNSDNTEDLRKLLGLT
jgi:hypothetical protein